MADEDIVFESTTDSPEQIAEGLGVPLGEPEQEAAPADDVVEQSAEGTEEAPAVEEPEQPAEPPAEETSKQSARGGRGRVQRKSVDGAAAAARRQAEARAKVLEDENAALRKRLEELAVGKTTVKSGDPEPAARPVAPVVVSPDDVPDTHPEVQAILAKVTALGPKPKQEDFSDFAEFEEKRDQWIEDRARYRARADSVREDVARREAIALEEANRAAAQTASSFQKSEQEARARHADYDEQMASTRLRVPTDVATAVMESPIGGELTYYLTQHPDVVGRLNTLAATSPHRALAELGMIEGRIAASLRTTPGAAPARPVPRLTKAPTPPMTTLGDLPSASTTRSLDDPNLSQAEYNRLRDRMDVESGRRTH